MADFDHSQTVSVTISPSGDGKDRISASDFVKQIDAMRELINLSGAEPDTAPQIVRLEMNSPALVVISSAAPAHQFEKFFSDLEDVACRGIAPPYLSRNAFDTLKEFASPVGRSIRSTTIKTKGREIVIDMAARKRIDGAYGADTSSDGTVDGMLEAINVHGKINTFALYPLVGAKRITCKFDEPLLATVRPALGQYVQIHGELKYRWREKFPFEALASKISVLPSFEEQPSFEDIIGMAPHATGGLTAEEFVSKVRHGW